ncbi:MAG: ABC transporter ATP-binding protein [Rhodospirillales bacterium]|nr:ABC transporter ATP-binding protein [Rhodospirillales bacterium]
MLLEVTGLAAGYGALPVLRDVTMAVGQGEIVAVLGANGAGKTTLNRVLSGLLRPRAGVIRFDETLITTANPEAIVSAGLIHVPEGRRIFARHTVEENLLLGAYRRGRTRRARNLARIYALFPRLSERRSQVAGSLSGGEQQMLAIGRGMMAEPRLMILDEPSLGLSPRLVDEMFDLVGSLAGDGTAILIVEQNVVRTLDLASRAYVLENGRIALQGEAATLARDPVLRQTYLGV